MSKEYWDEIERRTQNFRRPSPRYPRKAMDLGGVFEGLFPQEPYEPPPEPTGKPVHGAPAFMDGYGVILPVEGEEVRDPRAQQLQELLAAKGVDIEANGYAGPETIDALNRYLESIGMKGNMQPGGEVPASVMAVLMGY